MAVGISATAVASKVQTGSVLLGPFLHGKRLGFYLQARPPGGMATDAWLAVPELTSDAWLAVLELARHRGDQEGDMIGVAVNSSKQGLTPYGVEGLLLEDIEELGRGLVKLPQSALIRRCLGQEETLREAMKARMMEAPAQRVLLNRPQSALDLGSILNPTKPKLPAVEVSALLSEANLAKTPQSGLPAVALFQMAGDEIANASLHTQTRLGIAAALRSATMAPGTCVLLNSGPERLFARQSQRSRVAICRLSVP